jgi:hypothetical protein
MIIIFTDIRVRNQKSLDTTSLVVIVLAIVPKIHRLKPSQGQWIFESINIVARLPSEGK